MDLKCKLCNRDLRQDGSDPNYLSCTCDESPIGIDNITFSVLKSSKNNIPKQYEVYHYPPYKVQVIYFGEEILSYVLWMPKIDSIGSRNHIRIPAKDWEKRGYTFDPKNPEFVLEKLKMYEMLS